MTLNVPADYTNRWKCEPGRAILAVRGGGAMAVAPRGPLRIWRVHITRPGVHARLLSPGGLVLACVVLAGLAVRLAWWYGIVNVDPYAYADSAASIARWQTAFDPDLVGSLYYTQYIRFSLTIPAAVLYRFFGPGEGVSTIAPIAASLGTAVVAYRLAARPGGTAAGLVAASLAAFFPLAVVNSTQFLPDTMMTFFASLAMLAYIEGLAPGRSRRGRVLCFFLVGAAWALAFYGRPTAVALAIPFAALFALRRPWRLEVLAGVPGAAVVVLGVQLLLLSLGGTLFEDLHTLLTEGRGHAPGALQYSDVDFSYARYLWQDPMFLPLTLFAGGTIALGVIGGRHSLPRWPAFELGVLAVGQYLYFEFLMRLPGLYSWWKEPRYAMSMLVPLFALAGVCVAAWLRALPPSARAAAGMWVAGALALYGVLGIDAVREDHAAWQQQRVGRVEEELADFLAGYPAVPVFTWNDDMARYLSFYTGLDDATVYDRAHNRGAVRNRFDPAGRSLVTPGAFVLVDPGQDLDGLATKVPAHWTRAWERGRLVLYRVPPLAPAPPAAAAGIAVQAARAFPQQHVLVLVTLPEAANGLRAGEFGFACGVDAPTGQPARVLERTLPAGTRAFAVDLPVDTLVDGVLCAPLFRLAGDEAWLRGEPVAVPAVRVAEPEHAFTVDRDLERSRESGWFRFDQPEFGDGGGAIAIEPWRPLTMTVDPVPAGSYQLQLRVYDYSGGGANRVLVSFGGVEREASWGSGSGGVITVTVDLPGTAGGDRIVVTPLEAGQDAILIDRAVLTAAPP